MSGLYRMRVEPLEIEFASDEEDDGAHRRKAGVPARLALGGLEQSIEGFEEPIGLPSLRPCDNSLEVLSDHAGHRLHGFDFGPEDMGTPLTEHG